MLHARTQLNIFRVGVFINQARTEKLQEPLITHTQAVHSEGLRYHDPFASARAGTSCETTHFQEI